AVSQVRVSWAKRRETFDANLLGTFNLFEALRTKAPRARVLYVSSSDVYGGLKGRRKAHREEDLPEIVNPYGFTKVGGELLAEFYAKIEKLPAIIARPFPHTGPGQTADFVFADWARQTAEAEAKKKREFKLRVGNLAIRRDYSDVRDVVRAYALLLKKGKPGEVYNVCSGKAPSLGESLRRLVSNSSAKVRVEVDRAKFRKADIPYLAGTNAKLRRRTGWAPRYSLDQTLKDLLEDWRARVRREPRRKGTDPRTDKPSPDASRPVLITGGAGYIGSLLAGELLRLGRRVVVVDNLLFGGGSLLAHLGHPHFSFHKADVCDRAAIAPFFDGIGAVVHLAAIVGYPACSQAGTEASFACNLDGTKNAFELAEASGARRFVFASTYSNYGVAPDGKPVTEDSPLFPQSVYAETKIAAENYLLERASKSSCAPVVYRFATLFGPSPRTRFDLIINQFVWEALSTGKLLVYQPHYQRSFVHVRDVVRAVILALDAPEDKLRGRVFNVGSNAGNVTKEAVVSLIRKYAPEVEVEYRDLSFDGDMRDVAVSFDRVERELGWRAEISVEEGVRELVEAVRSGLLVKAPNGGVVPVNASGD
ncbi:MAG: NAD-dependent epimerase/dehydratase family protein, partial [Candidatus Aminicenantes bacterium]|nr:NAD-dependent epimerase/dehydratase family protein [Candidatus Aminicenantes bacterium]